jgi:hypothetical protein
VPLLIRSPSSALSVASRECTGGSRPAVHDPRRPLDRRPPVRVVRVLPDAYLPGALRLRRPGGHRQDVLAAHWT